MVAKTSLLNQIWYWVSESIRQIFHIFLDIYTNRVTVILVMVTLPKSQKKATDN